LHKKIAMHIAVSRYNIQSAPNNWTIYKSL